MSARGWVLRRVARRGRPVGLRTAKTVLAAVAAYVVALQVSGNPRPVLAPLTALLVVQLTLYETLRSGVTRVVAVVAGVLVALGLGVFVGFTWWSLGALIVVALVVGRLLRLGEQLMEVPISAMLVLAVSNEQTQAVGRVYETLVGAAVGVAVNALIAPPLYLQSAGDAIRELADRVAGVLDDVAGDLRESWSHDAAKRWLDRGRELSADVARAQRAFERAERSLRWNPRARRFAPVTPSLRAAMTAVEHAALAARNVARALADRAEVVPDETAYDADWRGALAGVLADSACAVRAFGVVAAADVAAATSDEQRLLDALAAAGRGREQAVTRLAIDPHEDTLAWQQHGALLTDIGRLLREIDPAEGPDAQQVPRSGALPRRSPESAVRDAVGRARGGAQRLRQRRGHG